MAELTVRIELGDIVERVLDRMLYKGKTLREWADYIANPKTNADRIRAMSDEELAERIAALMACMDCPLLEKCNREEPRRCIDMWIKWLKSPVEVGND